MAWTTACLFRSSSCTRKLQSRLCPSACSPGLTPRLVVHECPPLSVWRLSPVSVSSLPLVQRHIELGRALAPLRDTGVLIVASGESMQTALGPLPRKDRFTSPLRPTGMSFHNMQSFFGPSGKSAGASRDFHAALQAGLESPHEKDRLGVLEHWAQLPGAKQCHPREEHLIPLMVAAGAASGPAETVFSGELLGHLVQSYLFH